MTTLEFEVGDRVTAFHPRMMGVVKYGTIVAIGRKWFHVDFGELNGGTLRVAPIYITGKCEIGSYMWDLEA